MLFTLSEKRNEKLLIEWSGEITDRHAQDYCDVCNAVFDDYFDLDYMRHKYEANIYGKSFILVIYKDDKAIATWGAWRNDLDGKVAFQPCDFATLPEVRKGGYILDMSYYLNEEIRKYFPDAIVYGYPGKTAYRISAAFGYSVTDLYSRIYVGDTPDFQKSMPLIDDVYAENFMLKRRNVFVKEINGQCYLLARIKLKHIVPAKIFLGKVSRDVCKKFKSGSIFGLCIYNSLNKGMILGKQRLRHASIHYLGTQFYEEGYFPPLYKADTASIDFNGRNKH